MLLFRRARAAFDQLAKEFHPGLDAAAYGILALIGTGDATTVTALAERLSVGKPTVSRQVTALEELGFVTRRPGEPGSRHVRLAMTDAGHERLTTARARRQEQFRVLLSTWSEEDVKILGELLTRFNSSAW